MLIGHEQLITDFKRLADRKQLAHGYIFFGPPRVGKATFARALASYLETGAFETVTEGAPLGDLHRTVPPVDKESVGIDAIHALRAFLLQTPNRSPVRTAIIEAGELLTPEAQNALLKITEEPGLRALIIVVTDDPEELLPTLRSRLQAIHFAPVKPTAIAAWLRSVHEVSAAEASRIAARAHGCPGFAIALQSDERLRHGLTEAERFLKMSRRERALFIKELVQEDEFRFSAFLEALTEVLFPDAAAAHRRPALWHRLAELRRNANFYNLNPRLQLLAFAEELRS